MSSLNKSDLRNIKMFLARVIARGYDEEVILVRLVDKIDDQLHKEVVHHGTTKQTGKTGPAKSNLRSAKDY